MRNTGVCVVLALAGMACSSASTSGSGRDGGTEAGSEGPDGSGTPGPDAGSGDGANDHGEAGADGSMQPGYAGGAVTVTLVTGDGGAVPTPVAGTVTIRMVAATPAAISKIAVLVDGKSVGTLTAMPFDLPWDSSTASNGMHAISGTVYDLGGNTGTAKALQVTTSNFQLAGTWNWTGITDTNPGFPADPCSDTTFTVTFDASSGTMTFPSFYLTCTAGNGAPYQAQVMGFTTTVMPSQYGGPINDTSGMITTTFSTTQLTQSDSFNGDTQSGALSR